MTRMMNGKRMLAALLALLLTFTACAASAGTASPTVQAADSEVINELLEILDFKFFVKEDGIGHGKCPVFTAPYTDALRLADGKAYCNTNDKMSVGGYDATGWLMVRYELKSGEVRVGYIPPKYIKGYKANVFRMKFSAITAKAAEDISISDSIMDDGTPFGTIQEGTEFLILGKYTYTGNFWYVETTVDGQPARGFIDRGSAAVEIDGTVYHSNLEIGYPAKSPVGTAHIGTVTVTGDDAKIIRKNPNMDAPMVARAYGGDSFPCYATQQGGTNRLWYYIWVDGVWGWVSSGISILAED